MDLQTLDGMIGALERLITERKGHFIPASPSYSLHSRDSQMRVVQSTGIS